MVHFSSSGDLTNTERFLNKITKRKYDDILEAYGQAGVRALSEATPKMTGKTAESWEYDIRRSGGQIEISWNNTNVSNGVNIAVILDAGHGTGTGGYVVGRDYIKPTIRPIFDAIANGVWKEVTE